MRTKRANMEAQLHSPPLIILVEKEYGISILSYGC